MTGTRRVGPTHPRPDPLDRWSYRLRCATGKSAQRRSPHERPFRLLVRPSPIPDLGEILPMFGDILFVLDELVTEGLLGIRLAST